MKLLFFGRIDARGTPAVRLTVNNKTIKENLADTGMKMAPLPD